MELPDYQSLMLPVLRICGDAQEHTLREMIERLSDEFGLTSEQRRELLPSGRQPIIDNRVGWARTYLKKAGLLDSPRRGVAVITPRGKAVLAEAPDAIGVKFLERFEEFMEFRTASKQKEESVEKAAAEEGDGSTPEESLENAYQRLRNGLADEILETVKGCSPEFFERLVIELLVGMGYGGSRRDAGENVGKSGDGGIDGIIKEDRLGLDVIYIQAKRWDTNAVGRPEIQKFVGALQGRRARKGVFITTARFSKDAIEYYSNLDSKVVLIDGNKLAQLMMDFDIGVSRVATYDVKRLDNDYFVEE